MTNWESIILNAAILTALAIIGYFMKDMRTSVKETFQKHEKRINGVEEKLQDIKEILPQRFVLRDDYIRAMSSFGAKLDKTHEAIVDIGERIAAMEATHAQKD